MQTAQSQESIRFMSRYTGPSCKKCRKLDCKLFLKGSKCYTNCVIDKLAAVTKRGGKVRKAKVSEYGIRLQEKQKARLQSGMSEIPFRNLFDAAAKAEGQTGENFLRKLETRLDNTVRRLGFAISLKAARQLVLHGYVTVNGKAVNVPSYQLRLGDKVTLNAALAENVEVKKALTDAEKRNQRPSFLEYDAEKMTGKLLRWPDRAEMSYPVNEQLIVEYYSK
ncbi:MAG TPA: 30S ribosomal protein S4 [Elusimicrobia bacterium]|nr:30S ribosomal protein S4 [Elusimicrobiota bacterium]